MRLYKTLLLLGLFTLCACGGGGKSGQINKPGASSSSSVALSPQVLTFSEQVVTELQAGETITKVATGPGTGLVTYKSNDTWVASVDDSGFVTAKNPGAVTITASKEADSVYLAATSTYSFTVYNETFLNAWIGTTDTLLNFPTIAKGAELYRSSSSECDFLNYASCPDSSLTLLQNLTANDPTNLGKSGYFFLKSDKGTANVSVNLNSSFTASFPAVVSFKGRLWVIGGDYDHKYDAENRLQNNVWSSIDGINWKLETPAAAFSPRIMQRVVEHNGKLYLFGGIVGNDGTSNLLANDIWSSSDGINWVLETDHPAFSFWWSNPLVSFNNKLWVIVSSATKNEFGEPNSEIWSSIDGKNWKLELPDAAFSADKIISYQDKLWCFGGYGNEIWSSIDGINWIKEAETTGFSTSVQLLTPIVYDNKLWLLSGNSELTYFSQDGIKWTHAPAEPSYGNRNGEQILTFDNQIWLIGGGETFDKRSLREVWVSTDAHRWKLKTTDALFPKRSFHKVISHDGNLFLIGGESTYFMGLNDVWSSANGINWDIRTAAAAFAPGSYQKVASFKNKLWLIDGDSRERPSGSIIQPSTRDDVWTSNDGVTWIKESDDLWKSTEPSAITSQLVTFNDELWLLGSVERTLDGVRVPALWSSKDGISWQLNTSPSLEFADISGYNVGSRRRKLIVFKNKLWIIYDGSASENWSSANGVDWKKEDIFLPWWRSDFEMVVFKDRIWMIGGNDVSQGGWGVPANDIWSSSDGVNWKQEVSTVNFPARGGNQLITFNDQILLIGGYSFSVKDGVEVQNNEVWSSMDGIEWRRGYQIPLRFSK